MRAGGTVASVGVYVESSMSFPARPSRIITHTMALADAPKGYAIFDRKEDRAIKVMLRP